MSAGGLTLLVRHAPRRGQASLETLEVAMAGVAYEHAVTVVFLGEGVWHLAAGQRPPAGERSFARGWGSLTALGDAALVADDADLRARGLSNQALIADVERVTRKDIREIVASSRWVL